MKVSRLANLILIYLLMWGIAELVPDLIFGDASSASALMFTVFVPVQEQGGHIYLLNLHFSTLFEFLIPVIFAPIMVWLIFKEIKKEKSEIEEKSKYSNFFNTLFYISIFTMVVGLGIHYVGDAIDTQLQWSPEDIDGTITTFPKLIAYFFDEILGHKILYAGMMLILVCLYIFQYWHPLDLEKKETNYLNTTLLFIYGLIYGIALAFSFMEGQSAFEYLFICLILLVSTLIQVLRIKEKFTIKIKKYPYSIFFIAINAGVILVLLLYVPQIGNSYPFFPQ